MLKDSLPTSAAKQVSSIDSIIGENPSSFLSDTSKDKGGIMIVKVFLQV